MQIDKKEEEEKIEEIRKGRIETDLVSPTFGKFPMKFWIEWDRDCCLNYGGTRWMKAWNDHLLSQKNSNEPLWAEIDSLKLEIENLKQLLFQTSQKEKEEEGVSTFGGKIKG